MWNSKLCELCYNVDPIISKLPNIQHLYLSFFSFFPLRFKCLDTHIFLYINFYCMMNFAEVFPFINFFLKKKNAFCQKIFLLPLFPTCPATTTKAYLSHIKHLIVLDLNVQEQVRGFQCHHFNLESCLPSHKVRHPLLAECDQ